MHIHIDTKDAKKQQKGIFELVNDKGENDGFMEYVLQADIEINENKLISPKNGEYKVREEKVDENQSDEILLEINIDLGITESQSS